jgi:hypothetical protein
MKPVGVTLTNDAARVAGLGRIYFAFVPLAIIPRLDTDEYIKNQQCHDDYHRALDYSLFILLYLTARMPPKKIRLFPVFLGLHSPSTSTSRLLSPSHFTVDFIFG